MLTGEIRNQVDQIWNALCFRGVSNPLSVIEQITYLLFIKRLDELHTLEESKATTLGIPMARRIFPEGADERGRSYADMRWSRFKHFEPREMMAVGGSCLSLLAHARGRRIELWHAHERFTAGLQQSGPACKGG